MDYRMNDQIDPRTPVLIGVGQSSERIDQDGYAGLSAVELAAVAARHALADAGADTARLAQTIDTVAMTRQFENSTPHAGALLGSSDNPPRSVAMRIGAEPRRAILESSGGQSPQHLVNEFAREIAGQRADVVLICGGEAISTARHFQHAEQRPDFTETIQGDLEDRGYGLSGLLTRNQTDHGLVDAPGVYALFENARRARLGYTLPDYRMDMGRLLAPFTRVAAVNRHAAAPMTRSAEELASVSERNRAIADPFTRLVVARDQVNQGCALIMASVERARQLGVPPDRWVFLNGHADLAERSLLERPDLGAYPAAGACVREALRVAGIGLEQIDSFDLYSCFPIAVSAVLDALQLHADDPRGFTLTGGLPFFGGAGNNYSAHAIAEAVQRARRMRGRYILVGANGGFLSKYSAGIYSTRPAPYRSDDSRRLQADLDAEPAPPVTHRAEGWATIETYTVLHGKNGQQQGVIVGRLEKSGARFLANTERDDNLMRHLLEGERVFGQRVYVRTRPRGNRVMESKASADARWPERPPSWRGPFEFIQAQRTGRVLEITINRPAVRNSLHPPAHDELDQVFDGFFADPDLWAAIITGAGDKAFCAGNDLVYTGGGQPLWEPVSGFGGLTARRAMAKPVIAAVNGFAMGGGFEIALACHLVVADASARFALSEVKVGLIAGAGGLVRLPRNIPLKQANELILTGRQISASEALRLGVVNRVTETGKALEGARELAAQIVENSPTSVRSSLQVMNETQHIADTVDAVTRPSRVLDDLLLTQDCWEGLGAFAQKRKPVWRNR